MNIGQSILATQRRQRATSSKIRAALSAQAVRNTELKHGEEWAFSDGSAIVENNDGVFSDHFVMGNHH